MAVEQDIKAVFQRGIDDAFNDATIRKLAEAMAEESVKIMQKRTSSGRDTDGRKFGNYTAPYDKYKKKYIKGLVKAKAGGTTSYKASKVKDYLRLTGQLYDDMKFAVTTKSKTATKITIGFKLYIAERSRLKAEGLMATTGRNQYVSYSKKAWKFFGLSKDKTQRKEEEKQLLVVARKVLKQALDAKITVKG
jgi:hypothetical protein